jgi:two-component system cell cycle sensor histidine kinase/response regulator CckA
MKKYDDVQGDHSELRRLAEKQLQAKSGSAEETTTLDGSLRHAHELQVHQVELEMQKEELILTRDELEMMLARYTDLYDSAPVGYFTLDRDGTIRSVNLTGAGLLGVERSQLLNRRLGVFISHENRAFFADFLDKVFANKSKETCEIVFLAEKHSPLHVQIEAMASESGQECLAAVIDLTERRKLEKQLLQTQKMESVGLLAGGVAHDFNNMLTVISGCGETIRENIPADNELLRENIEQVLKAAERAADLTGRLLAFSRKQLSRPKPVAIDAVIGDASKFIRRFIGADIELSILFTCKELLVMADVSQIEMALVNLATNARDAMPDGGRLSISTKDVVVEAGSESLYDLSRPGRYALISVADTGAGIDKESMDRLFEPFYTTKEVGKGTGLGLSIVHGITKQHGGSVQLSSTPGEGTTFNIYLPLIEGRADLPESKILVQPAVGSETILVAEDEEMVRSFTMRMLERAGYRVIDAADGEEAVERFREHDDISLVLSDVVMPKKNGKKMFEEIKRIRPDVKVIFITGYAPDIMHKKGMNDEGVDFITKPFKKNELLRKIREVLDRG